jgi:hypothetical protein
MTTTAVMTSHRRTSRMTALAAGAALVVAGTIGVALDQGNSAPAATHAHPSMHSHTRRVYSVAPAEPEALLGSRPASPGAVSSDSFSGTTHPYPRTWSASGGSPDGHTTSQECRGCRQ